MTDDEHETSEGENDDGGDPLADRLDDVANEADGDHDPDADPFEAIGEGTGPRHGDPFDSFQDAGESGDGDDPEDRADPAQGGLPSGIPEDDTGFRTGADETAADPFTEFEEPTSDPFGEGETVFDNAATADIDGDDGVWERMESTDAEAKQVPGKRYVDVNKHSYCETCEYFSEPPDISCSHEGTEILEFVDMDTVRVSDCPIVAERKQLEDSE